MRLKDFLKEDLAVPFEFKQLPDFTDPHYAGFQGTCDGYDIYGSRFYGEDFDAYGILDDKQKPIAILVIKTKEDVIERVKFQEIEKLWVDPAYRGKALMISLLNFVIRKAHTNVSSGKRLTNDGKKLLAKIIKNKTFNVEFVDFVRNQVLNSEPADLFKYPNNYQIVMVENLHESTDRRIGHGYRVCPEFWLFRGDDRLGYDWD